MSISSCRATRAWIRPVSATFSDALRPAHLPAPQVDLARTQHAGYVTALSEAKVELIDLPKADPLADACFIEDCAVLLRNHIVLTHPGAPSRRPEVEGLASFVPDGLKIHPMTGPATLDGGDVLRIRDTLVVGRSPRTNDAGIEQLRAWAELDGLTVRAVDIGGGLHLKSACSLASEDVVVAHASIRADTFDGLGVRVERVTEPFGANVLYLGPVTLVSADAPKTAERLAQLNLVVRKVDVSQMHQADGALTCLSVRFPASDGWAT